MVDVSKVSQWVQKAVADIAAFEGKLNKIDKDSTAEKNALSALLAGNNLTPDDRDYIEGFMLDKNAKAEKINGLKPKKNESRSIEMPYNEPIGTFENQSADEVNKLKSMFSKMHLFFDEEGNVARQEIRGTDGELTVLSSVKHINENEMEMNTEQKMIDGSVITSKVIRNGAKNLEDATYKILDRVIKKDNKIAQEEHTNPDGSTVRTTYWSAKSMFVAIPSPIHIIKTEQSIEEFLAQIDKVEEVFKDGVVTVKYYNKDNELILSQEGHYTQDRSGYFITQFQMEE